MKDRLIGKLNTGEVRPIVLTQGRESRMPTTGQVAKQEVAGWGLLLNRGVTEDQTTEVAGWAATSCSLFTSCRTCKTVVPGSPLSGRLTHQGAGERVTVHNGREQGAAEAQPHQHIGRGASGMLCSAWETPT